VFGLEDELKVAPKGIDKGHKCVLYLVLFAFNTDSVKLMLRRDIDLLKCRSFAVFR
jgi:hypothetical protein